MNVWYYISMSEIQVLVLSSLFIAALAFNFYICEKRINSDSQQLTLSDLIFMIFSTKPSNS
jgi:hypothetical protein